MYIKIYYLFHKYVVISQAFWYTTQRGEYTGDVFGSSDRWNGLGIIFDSFDNDNKHNNPYIMAVVNDGTKNFDHKRLVVSLYRSEAIFYKQ